METSLRSAQVKAENGFVRFGRTECVWRSDEPGGVGCSSRARQLAESMRNRQGGLAGGHGCSGQDTGCLGQSSYCTRRSCTHRFLSLTKFSDLASILLSVPVASCHWYPSLVKSVCLDGRVSVYWPGARGDSLWLELVRRGRTSEK